MSLAKYRIYCNDEAKFVEGWNEGQPTVCFSNNGHTIDGNQTAIIELNETKEVTIKQHYLGSESQHFYVYSVNQEVKSFENIDILIPIKFDCNVYKVEVYTNKHNIGDRYDCFFNRNMAGGLVTEAGTDISEIKVSQTVIDNMVAGYFVKIGSVELQVIEIGTDTITVDGSMTVLLNDVVYITYYIIKNKYIHDKVEEMGTDIFNSFALPKGTVGGLHYYNESVYSKTVSVNAHITF